MNNNLNQRNSYKKRGSLYVILASIIVAVAIIGGVYNYFYTPKYILLNAINHSYKEASTYFEQFSKSDIAKLSLDNSINTTSDVSFNVDLGSSITEEYVLLEEIINSTNIEVINTEDNKNKERLVRFNSTIDNEDFLNLINYTKENNQYFFLEDIYDKYIKGPSVEYVSIYDQKSTEDISYLVKKVKDSFLKELKSSDFSKEKTSIKYNDEEVGVSKITLSITDKRFKEITKGIINDLITDSKSIVAITNLFANTTDENEMTKDDVLEKLDNALKKLNSNEPLLEETIYFSVYVRGLFNEIVRYDIESSADDILISYLTYENDDNNLVQELSLSDNSKELANFSFITTDEKKLFTVISENKKIIDGTYKCSTKEIESEKKFSRKQQVSLNLYGDASYKINININVDSDINIGAAIEDIDYSNAISYEEIPMEDQEMIINNLSLKLAEIIMGYVPGIAY